MNTQVDLQKDILDVVNRLPEKKRAELTRVLERRSSKYLREPVGIEEFITGREYLNNQDVYPAVLKELIELNNGEYQEAVLTGAIGSGKTTMALVTQAYQLYLLSCLKGPHREFGLDPSSEIMFVFQSINATLAKNVDYARFKKMIDLSPYFDKYFRYDKKIESELRFPNRIIVKPVIGDVRGTIGQNVFGGVIDEVNHMDRTQKSRRAVDGGEFDQVVSLYNSISRRRKSRFLAGGKLPGVLCLVGSKRFPGEFTDQRIEAAKSDKTIFTYDKRVWDIKPDAFEGCRWFWVFMGDQSRKPRVLRQDEETSVADRHLLLRVPEPYREDFERDIYEALRDVGGVSTLGTHPFFTDRERVAASFGRRRSIFRQTELDLTTERVIFYPKRFERHDLPRVAHLDLALTGDSVGLVIGHVRHYTKVLRGDNTVGVMPVIHIDGALRINPPKNGEINFEKIRKILFTLRENGLNIEMCTMDSFQSRDTIQILTSRGIRSGLLSVDRTLRPYDTLKTCLYENRLHMPTHDFLMKEILALELIAEKGKIDHPPNGSKDVADSLAGVVDTLTWNNYFWGYFGQNPRDSQLSQRATNEISASG